MFAKLAINNARKSIKDYLIYFITITLCVSLFYAFMSLSSSSYEFITEDSYNFEMLKRILKYATYGITALMVILIAYVNKYMLKRRQREFATYILLGTEQKHAAYMFFVETLIIGIISVFLGIFVGTLFSQLVTALVLLSAQQEIIFSLKLYLDTVAITFIFFITMFLVIGLYNIIVFKKLKLINMVNAEKQSEFQFKRSGKVYGVILGVSILAYCVCGYYTYIVVHNDKNIAEVSSYEMLYPVIILISFIIGTYTLFYSLGYLLIVIKERWINFKYENTNLFLIGSIVSKIKTAPVLMATISLTFMGAAVSFIVTLIMSQWALGYLDYRVPYDIDIRSYYNMGENKFKDIKDIPNLNYDEIIDRLNEGNYLEDYCVLKTYFINDKEFYTANRENPSLEVIKLSDFNKLRRMLGYSEVTLGENEYTTQWYGSIKEDEKNKVLSGKAKLLINEKELSLSSKSYYDESLGEGLFSWFSDFIVIAPDNACNNLSVARTNFLANTKKKLSYDYANDFQYEIVPKWYRDNNEDLIKKYNNENIDFSKSMIRTRVKVSEVSDILNATLAMRILGIYLGIVLLMISLTVLALQQLSDSIEHKGRFNTLRKLGIDEKEINKIVLKQIFMYFIIPIIIAIIGVVIFVYNFFTYNSEQIIAYIGGQDFITNIIIALILIICIYIGYFLATYYTFKRNIRV